MLHDRRADLDFRCPFGACIAEGERNDGHTVRPSPGAKLSSLMISFWP
jgi:hypothetical protein